MIDVLETSEARSRKNRPMTTTGAPDPAAELLTAMDGRSFTCVLADPPWHFINRTGKMAPEHKRLSRYGTMSLADISALPVVKISAPTSHLYLWVPNAGSGSV